MNITEAAAILRPGTQWNYSGSTLTQADDGTERVSIPTAEELQEVLDGDAYKDLRRVAYPPIGDQLDALWKGGEAAAEMLAQVNAVKALYPKPE